MTEFRCGSCKEISNLSQKSRYCPNCGSSSLNLVVKEQAEPAAKETIGVYTPPPADTYTATAHAFLPEIVKDALIEATTPTLEEDQPRRRSKRS